MPEVLLSPKIAIEILRDACGLNEEGESALKARVRQLIDMGVTGMTRETAHARHRYGLTEIAQLAVAIALVNAQVQPSAAARIVREGWPQLVPFAIAGIGNLLPERFRRLRPGGGGPHAIIEGNALVQLGKKSVRARRGGGELPRIHVLADAGAMPEVAGPSDSGTYLNSKRFMSRIFELMVPHAEAPEDIWNSLTRLRQSELSCG